MAETLVKRPAESRLYDMDFADLLGTGETLSAATVTANVAGLTIGATAVSGTIAQARISSGTAETTYHLTWQVTTSGGNTLEECGGLRVEAC